MQPALDHDRQRPSVHFQQNAMGNVALGRRIGRLPHLCDRLKTAEGLKGLFKHAARCGREVVELEPEVAGHAASSQEAEG